MVDGTQNIKKTILNVVCISYFSLITFDTGQCMKLLAVAQEGRV
jgi:hypothetical protein